METGGACCAAVHGVSESDMTEKQQQQSFNSYVILLWILYIWMSDCRDFKKIWPECRVVVLRHPGNHSFPLPLAKAITLKYLIWHLDYRIQEKKKKKGVLFFSQVIFNHRILECCSKKGKSGFFKSFIFLFSREMSCFPCLSFEHVSCSVVFNSLWPHEL